MIPLALFKLPSELLHVYCAVRSFDWQAEGRERAGCTASARTIAERIGKGERQTRDNLQRLAACGAVRIESAKGEAWRVLCTPESFDLARVTPAVHRRPPSLRQSTAGHPGSPPPQTPAADRRTPRQSTAAEVDTVIRSREVDTGSRRAGGSPTAPAPALVLTAPVPKKRVKREKPEPPTAATWAAYSAAYRGRYGAEPVRNARVNGQLAQLVARLGAEEAPEVAAFYVRHNDAFYATKGHAVGPLLADAEKLRTEWATGRQVNPTAARTEERSAANPFLRVLQEQRARRGTHGPE